MEEEAYEEAEEEEEEDEVQVQVRLRRPPVPASARLRSEGRMVERSRAWSSLNYLIHSVVFDTR